MKFLHLLDLDNLKMGYFILYRNDGSKFGKLIEKRQLKDGYVPEHACCTHLEVSGGGRYSINISPPRSKLVDITEAHKGRYIRVVRYKNEEYERKGRYKVAYFSASLCNKGYDVRGVLSFAVKWIKQNNRLFFCSEGGAWSLQKEFPQAFDWAKPSTIPPAAFCKPDEFETVWEGQILK